MQLTKTCKTCMQARLWTEQKAYFEILRCQLEKIDRLFDLHNSPDLIVAEIGKRTEISENSLDGYILFLTSESFCSKYSSTAFRRKKWKEKYSIQKSEFLTFPETAHDAQILHIA